jgi:hypothetical protein
MPKQRKHNNLRGDARRSQIKDAVKTNRQKDKPDSTLFPDTDGNLVTTKLEVSSIINLAVILV